ncbi:MAG: CopG family transcriptional regulator [Thermoprotei archaeon]|nr:MAG: CopG family transcriptional regulator [Thermoprotei archaeon]
MRKYVTISVKIPIEVKEKLEKYGIKPSELLKRAIYEELRRRGAEELEKEISELKDLLNKLSSEFVVKSIREDREFR